MQTQTLTFAVQTTDTHEKTARIGRGSVYQPRPSFAGGSVSWFDDRTLIRKHA